ncbi:MAG: M48 family metallopeptidase [Pyrinomonadaceae bacterium]
MNYRNLRSFAASILMSSMLVSTIVVMPGAAFAQTDTKTTEAAKDKNSKDKAAAKPTPTPKNVPLSDKENPAMIGKRNINKGSDRLFGWLGGSREKEMQIGRQIAMEVEQQAKLVTDPVITEYVNRVGQNIVLHSDAKVPFTIKVIDSDEVNAFALPGGFFFVNRGLILAADNESELAGVMAHEIAHVTARHAMENQGKGALINYGMLATIILGVPVAAPVLQNGGGILAALGMLKFSRGAEEEADRLGVQYLYAAGYDPTGMATMFEKLASQNKKKPGTIAKLFSTHPVSTDRRDASVALAARFPEKEEYIISTSEFQRIRGYLMKITNARAGVSTDFDPTDESRPTLKKRQPDSTDSTDTDGSSSSSDAPPKLKKKDVEPQPSPTPQI